MRRSPAPQIPAAQCQLLAPTPTPQQITTPQIVAPQITVGQKLTLNCTGSTFGAVAVPTGPTGTASWQVVPATPADAYQLYVLGMAASSNSLANKTNLSNRLALTVTSYRIGKIENQTFKISNGQTTFQTSPLSLTVASVMNPSHPVTKPYASVGPFRMSYPIWLWLAIGGAILIILLAAVGSFVRRNRRRRLRADMEKHAARLPAFAQFSKDARVLARKLVATKGDTDAPQLLQELEQNFRLYLIRELRVPALQLSDRDVLREIRRLHKSVYERCQSDLRRVFFELTKSRDMQIKLKDCEDLLFLSRRLADRIQAIKRRENEARIAARNRKGRGQ